MRKLLLFIFLLLISLPSFTIISSSILKEDNHSHYNLRLSIDPATGKIEVSGSILLGREVKKNETIKFYLHKNMKIHSLTSERIPIEYNIIPESDSPFMPDAVRIKIHPENNIRGIRKLAFEYSGKLSPLPEYFANVIGPEWIELGLYYPWFLYNPEISPFTYDLKINNIDGYTFFGIGESSKSNNTWSIKSKIPTNDIVVCGSKDAKKHSVSTANAQLVIFHHSFSEKLLFDMSGLIKKIIIQYNEWFGSNPQNITIVESKRGKGGGYARIGGIFFGGFDPSRYYSNAEGYLRYFAHEIAHLWWYKARTGSWEDWINESFAEFSALMMIREIYGEIAYRVRLDKKKKDSAKTPPVKNFDRKNSDHKIVSKVLYSKGPVFLSELEKKIGKEKFISFCKTLYKKNVKNTKTLLEILNDTHGEKISKWFSSLLEKI